MLNVDMLLLLALFLYVYFFLRCQNLKFDPIRT
uniref:Uncharacterized protein n=1 Tax=Arundo donax TaxID=35708 RepID=A0A0A8Y940_ARUDO